jgi:hypothetical protein
LCNNANQPKIGTSTTIPPRPARAPATLEAQPVVGALDQVEAAGLDVRRHVGDQLGQRQLGAHRRVPASREGTPTRARGRVMAPPRPAGERRQVGLQRRDGALAIGVGCA